MSCNPCCCSLKDSAVTIGIWSVVFSIAQLGIMGWQMAAIKYEKDRAANTLLPNYNTYGKYDVPSYYESYWQSPEERYYIGLFIIQVLCLISVFFLLFAAVAMIWGVHTWSKYLVWPWFPCMVCSILSSLAYCIMWWAGDVRDYWLALTIIEIIGVFVNVYCVVVVLMYYRKIDATTREFEGKGRGSSRRRRRPYSSRRDLLELSDQYPAPLPVDPRARSPYPNKTPYPPYGVVQPLHQPYPSPYSPAGVPQTPLPLPPSYTPYPPDPNEVQVVNYAREPKKPSFDSADEDPVRNWVKTQQKIERAEANSEPISPIREEPVKVFPMQHSRSVPSMFDGSLVSHKDCDHRHHHHRSSSRRKRSKSRHRDRSPSSETEFDRDRRRSSSRHRHRSKSRYSESEFTATTDHRDRDRDRRDRDRDRDRDRRHRDDDRYRRDEDERRSKRHRSRRREDDDDRDSRRKHRHGRDKDRREEERPVPVVPEPPQQPENGFPGFVVPQHIVIPPSSGERGPDGQPLPQKFQINSEITINYDQQQQQQAEQEPYRRRFPPMQITSNV